MKEITVTELAEKLDSEEEFILLDVREVMELNRAKLTDRRMENIPVSRIAQQGPDTLSEVSQNKDAAIYVICHHGNRSMQVAMWLEQKGWKNVYNIRGGIDEYARKIDQSVGFY
jgi:rhodanese-related sulfurtransferase